MFQSYQVPNQSLKFVNSLTSSTAFVCAPPLLNLNAAFAIVNYKLKTYVYTHWYDDLSIFSGDIYPSVTGHVVLDQSSPSFA